MQKNMRVDERDSRNEKLFAAEILCGIIYQLLVVKVLMASWRLYLIVRIVGYAAFVFPVLALIGIINVVCIGKRVLYSMDRVKKYNKDIFLIKVLALTS